MIATVGGVEFVAELELETDRFMVSEPVFAELLFTSEAGVELELSWMGRNRLGRPDNYRLTILDANGQPLATPDAGPQFGGLSWVAKLDVEPTRQRLFLPNWYDAIVPGEYTVVVETSVPARTSSSADWEPIAVALSASVEVVADDSTKLGELIESLGAAARADDSEAAEAALQKLAAIDDPRVLPHWLAIAKLPDYSKRFEAIQVLGGWNDDQALAALVAAASTRASELPADRYTTEELREQSAASVRLAATQALADSPHPGALEALLARKDDPDPSVRLTVLHRVAKLDDSRALPLLREFAKDDSDMVRGEAKRYLAER